MTDLQAVRAMLENFCVPDLDAPLEALEGGHINESWKVCGREGDPSFVLQRLNPGVFQDSQATMDNVISTTSHLATGLADWDGELPFTSALSLVPAAQGFPYYIDEDYVIWRCYPFIENAVAYNVVDDIGVLESISEGYGLFLRMMSTLKPKWIKEAMPGFHDTGAYLRRFREVIERDPLGRASDVGELLEVIEANADLADILPEAMASGAIPERIIHGDTKTENVLLDRETGRPACVIDLDTVMLGSALFDFGDLVRSALAGETEEAVLENVQLDVSRFDALVRGYLAGSAELLTDAERALMPIAGAVVTFECGVRFLTDYLEGDSYFRVRAPNDNLLRARNQCGLMTAIRDATGSGVLSVPN